jgi:autotransporter passenger strand-loop-strand repeat protein
MSNRRRLESGGFLSAHGLAYETTVSNGGAQTILSNGVDDYAQIYGVENIFVGKTGRSRLRAVAPATQGRIQAQARRLER